MGSENAIWLCQNCATLIDRDPLHYDVGLLLAWKEHSEQAAMLVVGVRSPEPQSDREIMLFFSICLDRPAFIDRFHQERSTEEFDKAIEDTITAFNTGALRARDGAVLQTFKGKSYLLDGDLRGKISTVVAILRAIRARYAEAKKSGEISAYSNGFGEERYSVHDSSLAEWFDHNRLEALAIFKSAADRAGIPYNFPSEGWTHQHWMARNTRR